MDGGFWGWLSPRQEPELRFLQPTTVAPEHVGLPRLPGACRERQSCVTPPGGFLSHRYHSSPPAASKWL